MLATNEHLSDNDLADLFLDTFPYNAQALLPVMRFGLVCLLLQKLDRFAARMAGSLLNAVGLPELITETEQDYEALIFELATNPTKLAEIKDKLAINRLNSAPI